MTTTSECDHDHSELRVNRRDPTRTTTLRRRYAQELRGRMDNVIRQIREAVIENDVFGLRANVETPTQSAFDFPTDPRKADKFQDWLDSLISDEVLEPVNPQELGIRDVEHYQMKYVRAANKRGIRYAQKAVRKSGIDADPRDVDMALRLPTHQQTLEAMWTRQFEGLKDITDDMGQAIREELTAGFAKGENPRKIERSLTDRVDKIGKTRATTLARTEVIRTHSESTLDTFERHGVDKVQGRAEWITAGDMKVCPICESLNGVQFTIQEARGQIPAHPRCRCGWTLVQREEDMNPERVVTGR